MLSAIKGVYDHGQIILSEEPLVKTKTNVIVTFLPSDEGILKDGKQKIILGMLEGKIKLSDDFDEPLEDFKDYM